MDVMEEDNVTPQWKEDAYQAVWHSGLLTRDVATNARIWRAVETALQAIEPDVLSSWAKYTMPPETEAADR